MPRVKRGRQHVKRRKKILKRTKGYRWGRKSKIRLAKTAIVKAGAYAYRDRRTKKRDMRALWNVKIGAAVAPYGMNYATFIGKLKKSKVALNRKILAQLAEQRPGAFAAIVKHLS